MAKTRSANHRDSVSERRSPRSDAKAKALRRRKVLEESSNSQIIDLEEDISPTPSDSARGGRRSSRRSVDVAPETSSPVPSQASDRSSSIPSDSDGDPGADSPPSDGGRWPGPPMVHCDDFPVCGQQYCSRPFHPCLDRLAPAVTLGRFDPAQNQPHGVLMTCARCREDGSDVNFGMIRQVATRDRDTGFRANLCRGCERDEAELYWARTEQPRPLAEDLAEVVWPDNGGIQNLCRCESVVRRWHFGDTHACYNCREQLFEDDLDTSQTTNEWWLVDRKQSLIRGVRPRMGEAFDRMTQGKLDRRYARGIGRSCPCGNESMPALAVPHMTYCQACMGVWVDPTLLPPHLKKDRIAPARNVRTRSQTGILPRWKTTKGSAKVQRGPHRRVNIERAWEGIDEFMYDWSNASDSE